MKSFILVTLLLFSFISFSQKKEDSKIIITLPDSVDIQQKIKKAFALEDIQVKDIGESDTLSTFPTEISGLYIVGFASVKANTVTLFGLYGLKRLSYLGYTNAANKYKKIIFYKGSKSWAALHRVAKRIGGEISYEE